MWSDREPDRDELRFPCRSVQHLPALLPGCKSRPWASPAVRRLSARAQGGPSGFSGRGASSCWGKQDDRPAPVPEGGTGHWALSQAGEQEEGALWELPAEGIAHLSGGPCDYPHFPGGKSEALSGEVACPLPSEMETPPGLTPSRSPVM